MKVLIDQVKMSHTLKHSAKAVLTLTESVWKAQPRTVRSNETLNVRWSRKRASEKKSSEVVRCECTSPGVLVPRINRISQAVSS